MGTELAVRVAGVGKRYRIGALRQETTLREHLSRVATSPARALRRGRDASGRAAKPTIWAVRDVSFDVRPGEVLGIVGRNGAGKSTLLKILSRITDPTEGRVELYGRVGSLLEVGTGFHSELSGRDNVFLNGAILGMRRGEIARKFDDIVTFAGVAEFIDTPVKRYSSGMSVRLAFAVAAHLEPEILIVDEVLAVGDSAFQKKCIGKISEVARSGRTVLFVSHNMGAVAELCTRAILLEGGRMAAEGQVSHVLERYAAVLAGSGHESDFAEDTSLPVSITSCRVERADGTPSTVFDLADEVVVRMSYVVRAPSRGLQFTMTLSRNTIDLVHSSDTDHLPDVPVRQPGFYEARFALPAWFLKAGLYTVRLTSGTPEQLFQDIEAAVSFEVDELSVNTHLKAYRRDRPGHVIAQGEWETVELDPADVNLSVHAS